MNAKIATPGSSAFALKVLRFLDKVEYRRCDRGEDFESICRLRYKAYDANGLLPPGGPRKISDTLDFVPNCHNFGVYVEGTLISTLRVHRLTKETPDGPSTTAYEDIVMPRLSAGEEFVDPSRFASDPDWTKEYPEIPYVTLRLAGMACMYFNVAYCLSTIRPEHSAFYRRVFHSTQLGERRPYPGVTTEIALYQANVIAIRERSFARYPFFRSSKVEQSLLFDRPLSGANAPLTVLPTASWLKLAA